MDAINPRPPYIMVFADDDFYDVVMPEVFDVTELAAATAAVILAAASVLDLDPESFIRHVDDALSNVESTGRLQ